MAFGSRGHADHDSLGQCAGSQTRSDGRLQPLLDEGEFCSLLELGERRQRCRLVHRSEGGSRLILGLHLDGALVYNQRKFSVSQEGKADYDKTYSSLDIPVNAKYRFTISGIGVYASTGPQFSFSMGSKNISVSNWEIQDGETPLFKRSTCRRPGISVPVWCWRRISNLGLGYNVAVGKSGETFLNKVGGSCRRDELARLSTQYV